MNGPSPVSEVRCRAHKGARIDIAWEGGELSFHLISSGAKHRHPLGSIPVACDPDAPARFVAQVWKKGDALQLLDLSASAMAPSPRQGYHPDPRGPFLQRFRPEVICSLTPSAACAVPSALAGDRPPLRLSPRAPRAPRAARLSPGQSATPRLRAGPPKPAASAAPLDGRRWHRRALILLSAPRLLAAPGDRLRPSTSCASSCHRHVTWCMPLARLCAQFGGRGAGGAAPDGGCYAGGAGTWHRGRRRSRRRARGA
jgi:hypothetical protein